MTALASLGVSQGPTGWSFGAKAVGRRWRVAVEHGPRAAGRGEGHYGISIRLDGAWLTRPSVLRFSPGPSDRRRLHKTDRGNNGVNDVNDGQPKDWPGSETTELCAVTKIIE
jgi:hypothetical protein